MPNKGRTKKPKRAGAQTKKAKPNPTPIGTAPAAQETAQQSTDAGVQDDQASKRFVEDLQVRGEAAPLNAEGKLPLHATHIIKSKKADGSVQVKRARFKLF